MKQRISKYKYLILALVVCAALLVVLLFGIFLPENVCIGGRNFGKMNVWQAWQQLHTAEKALNKETLTLSLIHI